MHIFHKKEYERFLNAGIRPSSDNSAGVMAETSSLSIAQTGNGNRYLLSLVKEGATDSEVITADLLLSYLIQVNKPHLFRWKKIHTGSIQGCENEAWPVCQLDLMPCLQRTVSLLYPRYSTSRPDKSRKKWIQEFVQVCKESTLVRSMVTFLNKEEGADDNTSADQKSSNLLVEFPSELLKQIASPTIPSDLSIPAGLYTFSAWARNRVYGGFFANRALLVHFKVKKKLKAQSTEFMPLPKFLNMTGLLDFLSWRELVSTGHRHVSQWFKSVINAPLAKGGMFTVEPDYDSAMLKITKLFDFIDKSREKKDESA